MVGQNSRNPVRKMVGHVLCAVNVVCYIDRERGGDQWLSQYHSPFPAGLLHLLCTALLSCPRQTQTSGTPESPLAGETLYQKLQTRQPTERAAVNSTIGDIVEDMLESLVC